MQKQGIFILEKTAIELINQINTWHKSEGPKSKYLMTYFCPFIYQQNFKKSFIFCHIIDRHAVQQEIDM